MKKIASITKMDSATSQLPSVKTAIKAIKFLSVVSLLADAAVAQASPVSFDFLFSGVGFGNNAEMIGSITFDDALLGSSGMFNTFSISGSEILDLDVTVSGASSGNGHFLMSDFSFISFSANGGLLDPTIPLIGQSTSGMPWGTDSNGNAGDFNLFGVSSAPYGSLWFQERTNGGSGDLIQLVSMTPAATESTIPIDSWTDNTLDLVIGTGGFFGSVVALKDSESLAEHNLTINSNGRFTQTGGAHTVSGAMINNGSYRLSGGSLSAASETVGGGFGYGASSNFSQSGGTNIVNGTLAVGSTAGSNGTYNLIAGALSAINEVVGDAGAGAFNQSGGTNTVGGTLTVGGQLGGQGTYSLSAGALTAASEIIGDAGNGTFTQGSGNFGYSSTNQVDGTLTLGKQVGGSGTYNLYAGALSAGAEIIGDGGSGSFYQNGGTNTVGNTLTLGKQSSGSGSYYLLGGQLTANDEIIGDAGYGSFYQAGGTHNVNHTLTLAQQAGSSGYYNLFGGALSDENIVIGDAGYGGFTQGNSSAQFPSEPTHTVTDTLTLGKQASGYGYYYLNVGKLSAKNQIVGAAGQGWFGQGDYYGYSPTNTTNTVSGTLTLGQQAGGQGTYNFYSGLLTAANEIIGDAGTGTFNQGEGNFGYSSTNNVNGTLTVGQQAGSQGIYNLIAGTLTALREVIGDAGTGTFNQSGGTNTVGETLTLGKQAGGQGTYNLSAGALAAVDEIVGDAGDGTFTQGQGNFGYSTTNSVSGTLTLGGQAGSHGIYNLIAGTLSTQNTTVGDAGIGTFNQSGGTHTVNETLSVGKQAGSSGVYNLSNGALSAANEIIGDAGLGTFNQLSGSNAVADTLVIGRQLEGSGAYNLTAGQLTTAKTVVGDAGAGVFTQTGGVHTTQALTVGNQTSGYGNYNLFGGTLNVVDEVVGDAGTGIFTQTGGVHKVDTLTLGNQNGGSGTYNLRGGNLTAGNIVNGAGTGALLISGGALNFGAGTHDVDVDILKVSGQGVINLTDGATTTFEKDVVHNGKAIDLATGTNAVFNAGFSGKGPFTGTGTATFNSVLNVGDGPVTFNIAGNATLGEHSKSIMEVAGLQRGTGYDAVNIGGALALSGELDLVSLNGFQAHLGDVFDLFAADTITGHFDLLSLTTLGAGLSWKIDYLIDAVGTTDVVRLSVVSSVPLPASIWFMQFALAGLATAARRKRKAA